MDDWNGRIQTITLERLAQIDSIAVTMEGVAPKKAREIAALKVGITPYELKIGMTMGF